MESKTPNQNPNNKAYVPKSLDRMEAQELASKQKLVFCCQLIAAPLSPTFCSTNLLSEESHSHATSGFCASKASSKFKISQEWNRKTKILKIGIN